QSLTTGSGVAVIATLTTGATGGAADSASIASPPADGALSAITGASGSFAVTYTPNAGFAGTDAFQFALANAGGSSTATVSVTVDAAPAWSPAIPAAEVGVAYSAVLD